MYTTNNICVTKGQTKLNVQGLFGSKFNKKCSQRRNAYSIWWNKMGEMCWDWESHSTSELYGWSRSDKHLKFNNGWCLVCLHWRSEFVSLQRWHTCSLGHQNYHLKTQLKQQILKLVPVHQMEMFEFNHSNFIVWDAVTQNVLSSMMLYILKSCIISLIRQGFNNWEQ